MGQCQHRCNSQNSEYSGKKKCFCITCLCKAETRKLEIILVTQKIAENIEHNYAEQYSPAHRPGSVLHSKHNKYYKADYCCELQKHDQRPRKISESEYTHIKAFTQTKSCNTHNITHNMQSGNDGKCCDEPGKDHRETCETCFQFIVYCSVTEICPNKPCDKWQYYK